MSKRRAIPNYQQPIIETHCHLDYLKVPLTEVIQQAEKVGIERIVTIAVAPDNLVTVRTIATDYEPVYATQGIHPHDAKDYSSEVESEIREYANSEKIVAIGEIGLDYYYDHSPKSVQRKAFEKQLQIAAEQDKPIVVHTREADVDTQAILAEFAPHLACKGVIHSFSSGLELAQFCLEQGFKLGFNGMCTFNKADNVRSAVTLAPIEQIVLETDAPYLTPVPYRGKENAPCYLPFIAEKIAEVKNLPIEQVLAQTYKNSLQLFFAEESETV